MKRPRISPAYLERVKNYCQYAAATTLDFGHVAWQYDAEALNAVEAMYEYETHGRRAYLCSEPEMLLVMMIGKSSREFCVKNWKEDVAACLFVPEEFFGIGGMRCPEEFSSVFGRDLNHLSLHRVARSLRFTIAAYAPKPMPEEAPNASSSGSKKNWGGSLTEILAKLRVGVFARRTATTE